MGRSLKIAIADDEPEVRDYFAKALASLGHKVVVVAADGDELINMCLAIQPDLLITDIRMPGTTGIEAMRALSTPRPLPTILISAHYRQEDLQADLNDQVVAFLAKPVKLADLSAAVAKATEQIFANQAI
ncbi:MAG: response regulator [Planctomycetota bacterium]